MKVFLALFVSIWGVNVAPMPRTAIASTSPNALPMPPQPIAAAQPVPENLSTTALEPFFQPGQIEQAQVYQSSAIAAHQHSEQLDAWEAERIYAQALALTETLLPNAASGDWSDEQLMAFINADLGLWGLQPSCAAECTVPVFALDLDAFQALADQTATSADEQFWAIVAAYYGYPFVLAGQLSGYPTFFARTWDYGGYSRLGSGQHLELLLQMTAYGRQQEDYLLRAPATAFAQQLQLMRHALLQDIWVTSNCSGLDPAAIGAELTQILDQVPLNPTEQAAIQSRIDAFASGDPAIQVNCQDLENCTCARG